MSLADLTDFQNVGSWIEAVNEVLKQELLFVSHPTAAGSADDSPLFRLKPSQVVAYELFTVTRHTANDGDLGKGASSGLIGGLGRDVNGDPDELSIISGTGGTTIRDTNVRYLIDNAVAAEAGLGIQYDSTGGIDTDNALPGIFRIPISIDEFGQQPDVEIETHTHEDSGQGGTLGRGALETETYSFAGSISEGVIVNFDVGEASFFPMIHVTGGVLNHVLRGHTVDAVSPDNGRFAVRQGTGGAGTSSYDVDGRRIISS